MPGNEIKRKGKKEWGGNRSGLVLSRGFSAQNRRGRRPRFLDLTRIPLLYQFAIIKCLFSKCHLFSSYYQKSKKKSVHGTSKNSDPCPSEPLENAAPVSAPPLPPSPGPQHEEVKVVEAENEQSNHAYSVVLATAAAAEAAAAAAQAAAEVVRLTTATRFPGKSTEEVAAIKIQTAIRGYLVYEPKCSNVLTVSDSFLYNFCFTFLHINALLNCDIKPCDYD